MNTGTGLSGSTDWNNAFRSRMYLETVSGKDTLPYRVFKGMKRNYGELGGKINLEFKDGLYVPVIEQTTMEEVIASAEVDEKFMAFLQKRMAQNRPISDRPGKNYAPAIFAADPEAIAAKITNKQFEASMERLFESGKLCVKTWGPPSKPVRWIVASDARERE